MTTTAARMLGLPLGKGSWPWYLEAAAFWQSERGVEVRYREFSGHASGALCSLTEPHVLELARREILGVVGSACPAHFFLAGGAFKSLLHGRSPRDLDFWAASEADRTRLVNHLITRGAKLHQALPFSDVFAHQGRLIDIPKKTDAPTLEQRLSRFDLALSAIGVEHVPDRPWRVLIDPRAIECAEARTIKFLKPLANWKHALTSLTRARRYARELGYSLDDAEAAEVWRVFDAQDELTQLEMINWLCAAGDTEGVLAEARARGADQAPEP